MQFANFEISSQSLCSQCAQFPADCAEVLASVRFALPQPAEAELWRNREEQSVAVADKFMRAMATMSLEEANLVSGLEEGGDRRDREWKSEFIGGNADLESRFESVGFKIAEFDNRKNRIYYREKVQFETHPGFWINLRLIYGMTDQKLINLMIRS